MSLKVGCCRLVVSSHQQLSHVYQEATQQASGYRTLASWMQEGVVPMMHLLLKLCKFGIVYYLSICPPHSRQNRRPSPKPNDVGRGEPSGWKHERSSPKSSQWIVIQTSKTRHPQHGGQKIHALQQLSEVAYCERECQTRYWKTRHKAVCKREDQTTKSHRPEVSLDQAIVHTPMA